MPSAIRFVVESEPSSTAATPSLSRHHSHPLQQQQHQQQQRSPTTPSNRLGFPTPRTGMPIVGEAATTVTVTLNQAPQDALDIAQCTSFDNFTTDSRCTSLSGFAMPHAQAPAPPAYAPAALGSFGNNAPSLPSFGAPPPASSASGITLAPPPRTVLDAVDVLRCYLSTFEEVRHQPAAAVAGTGHHSNSGTPPAAVAVALPPGIMGGAPPLSNHNNNNNNNNNSASTPRHGAIGTNIMRMQSANRLRRHVSRGVGLVQASGGWSPSAHDRPPSMGFDIASLPTSPSGVNAGAAVPNGSMLRPTVSMDVASKDPLVAKKRNRSVFGLSVRVPAALQPTMAHSSSHEEESTAGELPQSHDASLMQRSRAEKTTRRTGRAANGSGTAVESTDWTVATIDVAYATATVLTWAVALAGLEESTAPTSVHTAFIVVLAVCQFVTILWTASRFFVQMTRGDWDILDHKRDIRQHYLRTWCGFDVFFAVPLEFIFIGWMTNAFYWLQLRHVLRIVRLWSLSQTGSPLVQKRPWMMLYCFSLIVIFVVHLCAVVFEEIEGTWTYVDALYWAAMTLTSVGYGDILPSTTVGSRLYAVLVMFAGTFLVASVTSMVTWCVTRTNALDESVREKKEMLAAMVEHYRIPWDLQVELVSLLPAALSAENESRFAQLIAHMPPFVVEKVEGYTRAKALAAAVPLFATLAIDVMLDLAAALQQRFVQAGDDIISAGEEGFEMYFLVRGVADVIIPAPDDGMSKEDIMLTQLRSGAFFGEAALVRADTVRTAWVVAVTVCELLILVRSDFERLVSRHASLQTIFDQEVFSRVEVTDGAMTESPPQEKQDVHSPPIATPTQQEQQQRQPVALPDASNPFVLPPLLVIDNNSEDVLSQSGAHQPSSNFFAVPVPDDATP